MLQPFSAVVINNLATNSIIYRHSAQPQNTLFLNYLVLCLAFDCFTAKYCSGRSPENVHSDYTLSIAQRLLLQTRLTQVLPVQCAASSPKQSLEKAFTGSFRSVDWKEQVSQHVMEVLAARNSHKIQTKQCLLVSLRGPILPNDK